jgi:hypothetical protein
MGIECEPAIDRWPLLATPGQHPSAKAQLIDLVNQNAQRLGTGKLAPDNSPLIATGHQPTLWHPGILAKYLAAHHAAAQAGGQMFHIIVDQDVVDPTTLEVPIRNGSNLSTHQILLGKSNAEIPIGVQKPIDSEKAIAALRYTQQEFGDRNLANLDALIDAFSKLSPAETLAQQFALVLKRLLEPYIGNIPVLFASDLNRWPWFDQIIEAMSTNARPCVDAYNKAVFENPQAGVNALAVYHDRIELPLWTMTSGQPRSRVYVNADGVLEDSDAKQVPRALLMTALLRSAGCDLFVHGRGGAIYDRITENWWQHWRQETLAPATMATTDLTLGPEVLGDLPVADRGHLDRAIWYRHHLPHNIDRCLGLDGPLVQEKQNVLEQMTQDHDRRRRAGYFARIHQINWELAQQHPQAIDQAQKQLDDAHLGQSNRKIALKRDWCFALFPPERLGQLQDGLADTDKSASSQASKA